MNSNLFQRVYTRTIRIVAGIGTTVVFGMHTLPHVFPQKMIAAQQGILQGEQVSQRHKELLKETCELMKIDEQYVDIFYTAGFSTNSAGSVLLPNKAVIGLPRNAMFINPDNVISANITFENKSIDWNSNVGKALIESVMLDDRNIQFLLGHELTHIKDLDFLQSMAHATGCFYGFYKAGVYLPSLLKGRPFLTIALSNFFIWLCGVKFYLASKKYLSHHLEYVADDKSARLGTDYCEGGLGYMRKRLKFNRVIRKVFSENGEKMYSKVGNNLKDDSTHPKRTDRLKKLKQIELEYTAEKC